MTRRVAIVAVCLCAAAGCDENAAHLRIAEARRLSADLGVQFTAATDAANRAVMADTDEGAMKFAQEARVATEAVQSHAKALASVLAQLDYPDETRLLEEFERRFAEYRTLDSHILALALEGTNLEARQLSFGAVQEAADAFRDALDAVAPSNPAADSWRLKALAATALAGAREIQVLQAPHIAEPDDAEMTRLEMRMAAAETAVRKALVRVGNLVSPKSRPEVAKATAALDRLSSLNSEIKTLSRRNTNVRSLALSLGEKRTLTAACETALRALQDALGKRGLPTR